MGGIIGHPEIISALSPVWAFRFIESDPLTAFLALGGVVLAVTGADALFADMGNFGRKAIRRAWLFVVLPALTLNYLGQGALLVNDPAGTANPFFLLVPHWARLPMVVLATCAAVIASQAVISGASAVAHQASRPGYLPHFRTIHTSSRQRHQIYVPVINWLLMATVLGLVLAFRSSGALASAYGVAVTATITVTTFLFFVIQRLDRPGGSGWALLATGVVLLSVDLIFLAANLVKVFSGGWWPLLVGSAILLVFLTWHRGSRLVEARRRQLERPLEEFEADIGGPQEVRRVPGTAVFLGRELGQTPIALQENVAHNHVLHRHTVVLNVETVPVARVSQASRVLDGGGRSTQGIIPVVARFGYREKQDLLAVLQSGELKGFPPIHPGAADVSFFVSEIELVATGAPGMAMWRKHLYLAISRLAADPSHTFALPSARTLKIGARIEF